MTHYKLCPLLKTKTAQSWIWEQGPVFPGIVLSILGYQNITMVDSRKKKTEFVKQIIKKLGVKSKSNKFQIRKSTTTTLSNI